MGCVFIKLLKFDKVIVRGFFFFFLRINGLKKNCFILNMIHFHYEKKKKILVYLQRGRTQFSL